MKNSITEPTRHPKTKALIRPLALLLILGASIGATGAQDAPASMAPAVAAAPVLTHGDTRFIRKVARASTNEVALSQLADSRASGSDVKSFAQMMVTDHTHANSDLGELAKTKGVDISKPVAEGKMDNLSDLSVMSGADFDKAYAKLMVSAHEGAVDLFKDEVATGTDPDVVAFAKKYVGTLSMHLEHAQALEKTVNP
jgi:putative membrane protein